MMVLVCRCDCIASGEWALEMHIDDGIPGLDLAMYNTVCYTRRIWYVNNVEMNIRSTLTHALDSAIVIRYQTSKQPTKTTHSVSNPGLKLLLPANALLTANDTWLNPPISLWPPYLTTSNSTHLPFTPPLAASPSSTFRYANAPLFTRSCP
jgi:hypothetical protein